MIDDFSEGLAQNGIASLRYDKRGIGESGKVNEAELWGLPEETMNTICEDDARLEILRRCESVPETARPMWGKMSAGAMLAHLTQAMRMTVGELPTKPMWLPIRYFPLKQLIIYKLPFPKGSPTAPELLLKSDQPLATSKAEIRRLMDAFKANDGKPWPDHPAFGKLTQKDWGVLTYRHMDHHLRQFGV